MALKFNPPFDALSCYFFPSNKSTSQQPRKCGPSDRQCDNMVFISAAGVEQCVREYHEVRIIKPSAMRMPFHRRWLERSV